jgi:rod shape-determining protein MreD
MFFCALQVSFPQQLSFRGQTADFMLVIVILSGYFFKTFNGAVVGLIVGLIRDVMSGMTLGAGALIFMMIGIISSFLFSKAFHSRVTLAFLQVGLITLSYKIIGHLLFYFVPFFLKHDTSYLPLQTIIFDSILPQLIINLLIAVPLILLLKYLGPYRVGYSIPVKGDIVSTEELWLSK